MRIEHVADDFRSITVALVPRWYSGRTAAPHGGAALYAMVDPYFVFMVQRALGNDYLVWDKAGSIEVHAPGRGRVWARLELVDEDLRHMRQMTDAGDKHLHLFAAEVRDGDGMAIARVREDGLRAQEEQRDMSHFQRWPWPRVLAHRGAGTLAPENTLAALRVGRAHGFRGVEFDAMAPLDDIPVLMHDPTLERTTGVVGAVTALRAEQLARLDAGTWHSAPYAREPVPSLMQALQYCRAESIWPNVEIKPAPGHEARTGALVACVVADLYAEALRPVGDRVDALDARVPLLSSFTEAAIAAARAAVPACRARF